MCYVIVTGRSLLWTLMSLGAALAVLSALVSPRWLIGPSTTKVTANGSELFTPTVGVFSRCTRLYGKSHCGNFNIDGLATHSSVFPDCWKASLFFFALGLAVMTVTVIAALIGCCIQSIGKKSIFDLAGVAQSIAGITYLIGMTLYAAGWGSRRVQKLCGEEAAPFYIAECSLGWAFYSSIYVIFVPSVSGEVSKRRRSVRLYSGWAFYSAVLGVLLTFGSAVLSGQAEKSTASDKVQDQMNEGKTLICLA